MVPSNEKAAIEECGGGPPASPGAARVALVNMPFAMADRPSIQCGLLKAVLARAGHAVDVFYLNLELAAELGDELYGRLSALRTDVLLGEWLFSVAAFGYRNDEAEYLAACPGVTTRCRELGIDFVALCDLRNRALPLWIERWASAIDWGSYDAIGFTCTFEQSNAAFSLARLIKARHPGSVVLFGGASFDGDMGKAYLRALPFIDYAVIGEGDRALPQLIERIARGESPLGILGVFARGTSGVAGRGPAPPVEDLDELPYPDYDEYFDTLFRLERRRVLGSKPPLLLVENARGCWWGEKQHCTFCGLNGQQMRFRSRSSAEAVRQLRVLSARYKIVNFEAVDNILDFRYLGQFCADLAAEHNDYDIFYEVKANLNPVQLRDLARAGVRFIQPGIESLSSHVLKLMRKGITMLRNVRLLKWAHYYNMRVQWFILNGFPGETEEDYEQQLRLIPLLRHLPPPAGTGRLWLERFSPYFFDPSFPVRSRRPLAAYRFIYPESVLDLDEVAYFFHYEMDGVLPEESHRELRESVGRWQESWQQRPRPALVYQRAPDWIQFIDRRSEPTSCAFGRREARIYDLCGETERTVEGICRHLQETDTPATIDEAQAALDEFCRRGLMIAEDGRFLSLALPLNAHW
jgi:ribosomal peptide maturation radical SAM protein 1